MVAIIHSLPLSLKILLIQAMSFLSDFFQSHKFSLLPLVELFYCLFVLVPQKRDEPSQCRA